jgi:hypothetical protein
MRYAAEAPPAATLGFGRGLRRQLEQALAEAEALAVRVACAQAAFNEALCELRLAQAGSRWANTDVRRAERRYRRNLRHMRAVQRRYRKRQRNADAAERALALVFQ